VIVATNLQKFEEKIQVIQIVPIYIIIAIKVLCASGNIQNIAVFVEQVEKASTECKNNRFSRNSHKLGMRVVKFCFFFNFFSPILFQIISLFTQKSFLPMWTPQILLRYEKFVFMLYWTLITFCGLYCSLIVLSIDLLMIYLLFRIEGYSRSLVEKTVQFELNDDDHSHKNSIKKLLEEADNLRR
jgi:hypothetical protein